MSTKKSRKLHTQEFKVEALKPTQKIDVAEVAHELNLYESLLHNWRSSVEKKPNTTSREAELAEDLAILKRRAPTS